MFKHIQFLFFTIFSLVVFNLDAQCNLNGGNLEGGPFEFCVGDQQSDRIPPGSITLSSQSGPNNTWVITDDQGNILGLPPMPSVVNFDGAGAGTCLIWHLSYENGLLGLAMGNNLEDLQGCSNLSNSISVVRNQPDGGEISIPTGMTQNRVVIANRASGTISVIDSDNNEVISTHDMPNNGEPMYAVYNSSNNTVLVGDYGGRVVAFDAQDFSVQGSAEAGAGVFHMWLSPDNQQLWVNNELDKTVSVINPNTYETLATIAIPTDLADAGFKPHDVIVMPNNAAAFVTLLKGDEDNYVIKYDATTFMETARTTVGPDPHLSLTSANDKLYVASQGTGELAVLNRSDLSTSTIISIPNAHGLGMNQAGTHLYVGNISEGGMNATYTVDLSNNTVLGAPVDAPFSAPHNYAITSDDSHLYLTHSGSANDKVSVYSLSPTPTLVTSLSVGNNPFGLVSYSFESTLTETTICAGDNISDAFEVTLSNNAGSNSGWVITDNNLNILGLPPGPPFDLEGAGAGTCLIWSISYEDGLVGLEMGMNAGNLQGCYDLSNPITVYRNQPEGGNLAGGPFTFCVGNGLPDMIPAGSIALTENSGPNTSWIVTDEQGNILGLPPMPSVVNFDGAGFATCLIWNISYEDGLEGLEMGMNTADLNGCYALSNPVAVNRINCNIGCNAEAGKLYSNPIEFCVGDGRADYILPLSIVQLGATGNGLQWVITDDQDNILGLPQTPWAVNFDEAPPGVCRVYLVSYDEIIMGLEAGNNLDQVQGCFDFSNYIEVNRVDCNAGTDLLNKQGSIAIGKVYPIPTQDQLFVNLVLENDQQTAIQVYDTKGRLMIEQNQQLVSGFNQLSLEVAHLAEGVYFLSVLSSKGAIIQKRFVKTF